MFWAVVWNITVCLTGDDSAGAVSKVLLVNLSKIKCDGVHKAVRDGCEAIFGPGRDACR